MFPYAIDKSDRFVIDDIGFHVTMSPPDKRPASEPGNFTIVKRRALLDVYGGLSRTLKPRAILEIGVYQGGSYVLLDKLFKPERISAVEISKTPVAPLVDYCRAAPGRSVHFDTSQTDEVRLKAIVEHDLGGGVDLIVDDASHRYDLTRRSFEILFPLLSPGGNYIIEDWAWSHMAPYQSPDGPWHARPALTNLLVDLVALQGSTGYIGEIKVLKPAAIIRKARTATVVAEDFFSETMLRGRHLGNIL